MTTNDLNKINESPLISQNENANQKKPRYFGIDLIRVISCFLVMHIHAGEFYYCSSNSLVSEGTGPFWNGILNSLSRVSVPLFVMISGYLLLPVKVDLSTFLKTRFTRVLFPFIFWSIAYAFYNLAKGNVSVKDAFLAIPYIFVNFQDYAGHLWYIYMLIGIYLYAPIISPWIKTAPLSHFIYYFVFWIGSLFICYIHLIFPEIWGECAWNNTPMLQNFTGHFGYALLGCFVKLHLKDYKLYWLGIILIVFGYIITLTIWEVQYHNQVKMAPDLELGWNFHSINVAMMTFGIFLLLRKLECKNEKFCNFLQDVAIKTYGMYLTHIFFLDAFHEVFDPDSKNPIIFITVVTLVSFISSYIVIKILSYIPFSKYIIG